MDNPELRQRKPVDQAENDEEEPQPRKEHPYLKYGLTMQIVRSLLISAWFDCCCVIIVVTQLIGSPLYLINKDYYYSYMAMTKQNFG